MVSRLALASIYAYQQWLSPHKGFRCAHSVLHGGTGCSGFAKHAIRDHGLWAALPAIRERFRACKHAARTLRDTCPVHARPEGTPEDEDERGKKKKRGTGCLADIADAGCTGCGAASCLPVSFCGAASAQPEKPSADPETEGCGDSCGSDCSGLECNGCDCGSPCN